MGTSKGQEKSINASIERYLKEKSFSDRTEEERLYLWETSNLSKEYNFYDLLSTINSAEFDENLIEYEKKMKSALEPMKKLNNYEKELNKIFKIVASWRERKMTMIICQMMEICPLIFISKYCW